MQLQAADGKRLWLLTVTAPGSAHHRRWAPASHYRRGAHREVCTCNEGVTVAEWNPTAAACWNRLRTAIARRQDLDFYRAAEVQDGAHSDGVGRGALHHHIVLAARELPDVLDLQLLALAAGFGCVIDLQAVDVGADLSDLAGYVSKRLAGYVSKSSGRHRDEVPWRAEVIDQETGEIVVMHTAATYRTHSQSAGWGCTVKEVRQRAQAEAKRREAHLREVLGSGIPLPRNALRDLPASASAPPG